MKMPGGFLRTSSSLRTGETATEMTEGQSRTAMETVKSSTNVHDEASILKARSESFFRFLSDETILIREHR